MGSSVTATWLAAALCLLPVLGQAACSIDQVELRGEGLRARFSVEVADSDAERAKGLMFRDKMATSRGMLFVYPTPRRAQFWMKDTLIPLDMIFLNAQGVVTRVHSKATPKDVTPIDGGADVQFVLEINGGLAARMGIAAGAELRHPAIAQDAAVWPCSAE